LKFLSGVVLRKLITACGSDGSIVFGIVVEFFAVNTITHEPLDETLREHVS